MKIVFTTRFNRSYKRLIAKNEKLKETVNEKILLFEQNTNHEILKDHPLKGKLYGYRAFSIGYDLRLIYKKIGAVYVFYDIGTHDDIYS